VDFIALIQEPFDFESLFANAVRFVPMDFSDPDVAILQTDTSFAFEFPPTACAILSAKAGQVSDAAPPGNDFNLGDPADNLEVHAKRYYQR
jgi:hypothetical protein